MKKLVVLKQHIEKSLNAETGEKSEEVVNTEFIVKDDERVIFAGNVSINGLALYSQDGQNRIDIDSALQDIKIITNAEDIQKLD